MTSSEVQSRKRRRTVVDSSEDDGGMQPSTPTVPPTQIRDTPREPPIAQGAAPVRPPRAVRSAATAPKQKSTTAEGAEKYAYDLINSMREIYRQDREALEAGRAGLLRLRAVDGIAHKILRKDTQEACVRMGVLGEVKHWLEPLPDSSLPSQKIKKALLETLCHVKATRYDLASSGVGKIVYFYSRNTAEAKDVRKLARDLVAKWKAMIIKEEMEE